MRTLKQWLTLYGESHQNPANIAIHKICVPTIVFTAFGLLWTIPVPDGIRNLLGINGVGLVNAATLAFLLGMAFYLRLSGIMALGMGIMCAGFLALLVWLQATGAHILQLSVVIFVVAWIGQFIGHKIEGKKPSFFEDLQFLLIGPAWTLAALYRGLGIRY
ncbi:Mpo1-like protein [Chitinivorax sp. PXF-14]|uniref:Mpo1 family 2-hydroxy fatty acid dioxygenase n=1 Tax=Chitinivorax sp. PXF-14 TaxID=3230488 RepID=UPI0034678009